MSVKKNFFESCEGWWKVWWWGVVVGCGEGWCDGDGVSKEVTHPRDMFYFFMFRSVNKSMDFLKW